MGSRTAAGTVQLIGDYILDLTNKAAQSDTALLHDSKEYLQRRINRRKGDMFNRTLVCSLLTVAVCVVLGCQSHHLQQSDIRWVPGTGGKKLDNVTHVTGLRQALADSPNRPVSVLVVHGMIENAPNYSRAFQKALSEKLGLVEGTRYAVEHLNRGYKFIVFSGPQPFSPPIKQSEVRKTTWVDPKDPARGDRLMFYELLWAPLRDELKKDFLSCFESPSDTEGCNPLTSSKRNGDTRALINGYLKDDILVNGFADAMLVLSPLGDVLRDDVSQAMCVIAGDVLAANGFPSRPPSDKRCDLLSLAPDEKSLLRAGTVLQQAKFFSVTHSLGSFLVLDTQQRFATSKSKFDINAKMTDEMRRDLLLFWLTDQSTVFMMANQIGLLQLARLTATCDPTANINTCPTRLLPAFEEKVEEQTTSQFRTYVAFNDVNDLLGFELQPYLNDMSMFGPLINVSVRNPAFSIPWVYKSPKGSHTHHFENPIIIETVVEGFDLK